MTFNVQNLFPVQRGRMNRSEFDAKVRSLAAVLDTTRPHVVGLQEIGSESALLGLQAAMSSHAMPHFVLGRPDQRGIRVGFLSTRVLNDPISIDTFSDGLLPVQSADGGRDGPDGPATMTGPGRGGLQVTVRANGCDVLIVNCHLKSKLLTFPTTLKFVPDSEDQRARFGAYALFRRAAEATAIRTHMTSSMARNGEERPFVVLGDLNDEADAATTQILSGPPGSEIGTRGFDRSDVGDKTRLFNLAPLLPAEERFSRVYRGRRELIDHVLVSHFLATRDPTMTQHLATPSLPSIDDDADGRRGKPGSDHAALMATFDW